MKYVGLTDNSDVRKVQHGNPKDWWCRSFTSEKEARQWEADMIVRAGFSGWKPLVLFFQGVE